MGDLLGQLGNGAVFTDSLRAYWLDFSLGKLIMSLLAVFSLVGLGDKLRGGKAGYGARFDEGFGAMGPLALVMVGMISLSPLLLLVLGPVLGPLFRLMGASPAMLPASLLALDMGGYALATQMAGEQAAVGQYAGIVVASTMGITFSFTIPYALSLLKKEDHPLLAMGILLGIVAMPVGCLLGGLAMGLTSTPIGLGPLFMNTLPVLLLSATVGLGLALRPAGTMRIFAGFGRGLTWVITVSPGIAIVQYMTGLRLPLFSLMVEEDAVLGGVPFEVALLLVGQIAVVLTGAFPMVLFLSRKLGRVMGWFGGKLGIDKKASTGLLTQLANSIPVWNELSEMGRPGKLANIAFAVCASFVFGDSLAFTGGVNPEMILPLMVAKLSGGALALLLVNAMRKRGKILA